MSSKVLSLYCLLDVQDLVVCLTCELLKSFIDKIILKSQCKSTFKHVFVGKNFIKIGQEFTLQCFEKMSSYMKYTVKHLLYYHVNITIYENKIC